MEIYTRVRQASLVSGKSIRSVSKEFGLNRRTVSKMVKNPVSPGYKRSKSVKKPKLSPHMEFIDQILSDDKFQHKKQRHTARRIFTRLREECGYEGGYTIVREYVSQAHKREREMFCPLSHQAGWAQVDFGEAIAVIGGEEVKAHFFVMDLPQSDSCFVKAYPRENTEAFCEGHVSAFAFLGGVPKRILYDNTKIAVARILGDGKRKRTRVFCELQSHYLFEDKFARVGKGNDKGKVENLVGYARRNFMVPIPNFESFDALNKHLEMCCVKRQKDVLRGHKEPIGERLRRDQEVFLPLPPIPYDAYDCQGARVSSQSLVRYKGNDYSVPVRYGYRDVLVKGYVQKVVISCGSDIIATHERCYGSDETVFYSLHYLPLLEQKTGALEQAAPLVNWNLPLAFGKLKDILERRAGKSGKREYVCVLRLLETFKLEDVTWAIQEALHLGVTRIEAIKHLILCRLDNRPARLDLSHFPKIPVVIVKVTPTGDYQQLLGSRQ